MPRRGGRGRLKHSRANRFPKGRFGRRCDAARATARRLAGCGSRPASRSRCAARRRRACSSRARRVRHRRAARSGAVARDAALHARHASGDRRGTAPSSSVVRIRPLSSRAYARPATGRLLAEMMTGAPTYIDPRPYRPSVSVERGRSRTCRPLAAGRDAGDTIFHSVIRIIGMRGKGNDLRNNPERNRGIIKPENTRFTNAFSLVECGTENRCLRRCAARSRPDVPAWPPMYRNTLLRTSQTLRYILFPAAFLLIRFRVAAAEFRLKFTLKSLLPCNRAAN